jgi:molybdate transport system substrate-binding protein
VKQLALAVFVLAACSSGSSHISIGVAASLRHAMPELAEQYRAATGVRVDVTFGASDMLADDIQRGHRLDALVVADAGALDRLVTSGAIDAGSRKEIATNAIVLVGPPGTNLTFRSLAALPPGDKIAIGDPLSVPAGRYAEHYLMTLGQWDALQGRLVLGGDVAGVLALAKQGRARVAVVYRTDAAGAEPLVTLDAPQDAPTTSVLVGVASRSSHAAAARAFARWIAGPDGQQILARHGFGRAR